MEFKSRSHWCELHLNYFRLHNDTINLNGDFFIDCTSGAKRPTTIYKMWSVTMTALDVKHDYQKPQSNIHVIITYLHLCILENVNIDMLLGLLVTS